jgi:hypothetical protein
MGVYQLRSKHFKVIYQLRSKHLTILNKNSLISYNYIINKYTNQFLLDYK